MSKDAYELPDEHVAYCCWCKAPLVLEPETEDETGPPPPAWCSGSEECRQRQRDSGMSETLDGKTSWLFLPTPKQVDCMLSKVKNLFIWGNRGGGKSVCIRWLCHAMALAIPGFKYAILRTSFVELEKNHLIFLNDEMEKFGGNYNKTAHICYYPNGSIGFYAQCETDADVDKILGAELSLLVFDEAPTFKWLHIRLIAGSVRVRKGRKQRPRTIYLGNPTGECIDELFAYCIDKDVSLETNDDDEEGDPEYNPDDWGNIEMRMEDNPHLDYAEYRTQFAGQPKHIRRAWLDGVRTEERTLFEFYPNKLNEYTDTVEPYHVIHELPRTADDKPVLRFNPEHKNKNGSLGAWEHPDWIRIYRAYDHGFFPDPAVMLWFMVIGKMIVVFKERTWFRTIAKVIAKEAIAESQGMRVVTTYNDPSIDIKTGHDIYTTKQIMENEGMAMDSAVNDRVLFADVIHRLLGEEIGPHQPRVVFYDRGCPMLIKYIPRYKWDKHDPTKLAEHKQDHYGVTFAYFGMSQIPVTKPGEGRKNKRWLKRKPKHGKRI